MALVLLNDIFNPIISTTNCNHNNAEIENRWMNFVNGKFDSNAHKCQQL